MGRYLVVAHRTATSPQLLERASDLARRDRHAQFTLLVPATHSTSLLDWDREERFVWDDRGAEERARRRMAEAEARFHALGLRVTRSLVGDPSPALAVADELRASADGYDAIVLSTLPQGRSRWLAADATREIERHGVPVIHVEGTPRRRGLRASIIGALGRIPLPAPLRHAWQRLLLGDTAATMVVIVALMVLYLAGGIALAIRADRGFLLNDALAVVTFTTILAALAGASWWGARSRG